MDIILYSMAEGKEETLSEARDREEERGR